MKSNLLLGILISATSSVNAQEFNWAAVSESTVSYATAVGTDKSGNVFTAIQYVNEVDLDPSTDELILNGGSEGETSLQKLDADGNLVWVKTFKSFEFDGVVGNAVSIRSVITDWSGNVYIAGAFSGTVDFDPAETEEMRTGISSDIFVLKLDNDGNYIWVNTIGGNCYDHANAIALDQIGNVCVTGSFCLTADFDEGPGVNEMTALGEGGDVFVLKLDANGSFLWATSVESDLYDDGNTIITDKDNNIFVGGYYYGYADFDGGDGEVIFNAYDVNNPFLLKLDEQGDLVWAKTIEGEGYAHLTSIDIDSHGNLYAVGDFGPGIVDFDMGPDVFNMFSAGEDDIFIVKMSNAGEFLWAKQLGGAGNDRFARIEVSAINTVYISGVYSDEIDVDPGDDEFILAHPSELFDRFDPFLVVLTEDGEFINGMPFTGENNQFFNGLTKGIDGSVYLAGLTESVMDLDPGIGEAVIVGEVYEPTAFVIKLQDGSLGLATGLSQELEMTLYPNPVKNGFQINLDQEYENVDLEIKDNLGRIIKSDRFKNVSTLQSEINAPAGIYFVHVTTKKGLKTFKVVKN